MSPLTKGYLSATIAIIVWSTTGIFIGHLITYYQMPPLLLALWRNALVCVALFPALALIQPTLLRIDRAHIPFYAVYGFILALFNSIWTISVEANGASVATVLAYSSAGFTAVLAWWIFRETLGLAKIIGVTLSLIGCVLVSNAYDPAMWSLNPLGIVTGLSSGLLFAGYNLMGKETAKRQLSAWTSLLYSFGFASLFILAFNLLPIFPDSISTVADLLPHLPLDGWVMLIVLAFIPTLLGFGLYNLSMNYLQASTASLLATSEPAITAVLAYLFLGERLTAIQIIGSLLILSAVIVARGEKA